MSGEIREKVDVVKIRKLILILVAGGATRDRKLERRGRSIFLVTFLRFPTGSQGRGRNFEVPISTSSNCSKIAFLAKLGSLKSKIGSREYGMTGVWTEAEKCKQVRADFGR